jgi:tripartite-type tricarboxylate transporter receptor subunit TctC
MFAPFFQQHIPGNPTIVIQNMPGAGGIRAMMNLASVAPRDGSVIGLVHSSVPFAPLYGIKGANFDPRQMNWIGSMAVENAMCVAWASAKVEKWNDLFEREYIVGGTGAGSQMETLPLLLNKLFGTKIKIVSGYKGGNDVYMAMERGEVHGRCGGLVSSINSTRPEWFSQNKVTVPILIALQRKSMFPDTPAIIEFAKDERTRRILQLTLAPQGMDRPVLAPPNVPADRLAALKKAFSDTMRDPAFIAEAKRQNIEIEEVSGEEVARIVADAYSSPKDIVEAAREAMNITAAKD